MCSPTEQSKVDIEVGRNGAGTKLWARLVPSPSKHKSLVDRFGFSVASIGSLCSRIRIIQHSRSWITPWCERVWIS